MPIPVAWEAVVIVGGVVFLGGLVKGTAGFGYAVASTAILATMLAPSRAIVVVILPMLAANIALLGELGPGGLRRCVQRFWPYIVAALAGRLSGWPGSIECLDPFWPGASACSLPAT